LGKNVEGAGFPFQVDSLKEEYEKYEWEQKSLSGLADRVSMRRHGYGRSSLAGYLDPADQTCGQSTPIPPGAFVRA